MTTHRAVCPYTERHPELGRDGTRVLSAAQPREGRSEAENNFGIIWPVLRAVSAILARRGLMRYRPILRNRRRGHGATADLKQILPLTGGRCLYCGVHIAGGGGSVDHFVPLSHGGTYAKTNLVPACHACNASKADHEPWGWIEQHCDADARDRVRRYQRRAARL